MNEGWKPVTHISHIKVGDTVQCSHPDYGPEVGWEGKITKIDGDDLFAKITVKNRKTNKEHTFRLSDVNEVKK